jgi:hypothetical protein
VESEKDKQRRISKMAHEQRERHKLYRRVDELTAQGVFDRKNALIDEAHDRIVEARRKAAVYDGDLDRARPAYYVGPGWHPILDDLVQEFAEIDDLGFLSAHEKFGGLRVTHLYSGDRQTDVDAIIKRVSDRALAACWYCGQAGRMRQERWWRVRCDEHWNAE